MLQMAYAICDILQSAQSLKIQPPLLGKLYTHTFQMLNSNTNIGHVLHT